MKNKPFIRKLLLLTLVVTVPLLGGCIAIAAAGAGAGTYVYMRGSLDSHLPVSLETAMPAVSYAMDGMGLLKVRKVSDMQTARFTYRDSLDTRIVVSLTQKQQDLTSIKILVGRLGDESRSIEILARINDEL